MLCPTPIQRLLVFFSIKTYVSSLKNVSHIVDPFVYLFPFETSLLDCKLADLFRDGSLKLMEDVEEDCPLPILFDFLAMASGAPFVLVLVLEVVLEGNK